MSFFSPEGLGKKRGGAKEASLVVLQDKQTTIEHVVGSARASKPKGRVIDPHLAQTTFISIQHNTPSGDSIQMHGALGAEIGSLSPWITGPLPVVEITCDLLVSLAHVQLQKLDSENASNKKKTTSTGIGCTFVVTAGGDGTGVCRAVRCATNNNQHLPSGIVLRIYVWPTRWSTLQMPV